MIFRLAEAPVADALRGGCIVFAGCLQGRGCGSVWAAFSKLSGVSWKIPFCFSKFAPISPSIAAYLARYFFTVFLYSVPTCVISGSSRHTNVPLFFHVCHWV